jgi:uracil-DNA glycosylase family 4
MSDISRLVADVKEQVLYLRELGGDALEFDAELIDIPKSISRVPKSVGPVIPPALKPAADSAPRRPHQKESRLSSLPSLSKRAPVEPDRSISVSMPVSMLPASPGKVPELVNIAPRLDETIESIHAEIGNCTRCKLHSFGRKQVVHTTGNFRANLMFVGEAPGADEDEQGFPFVGRAGQLLTKIIESIGIKREEVCIGNINRCRPPGNRQPEPDETAQCRPFILREIAVVKPKVIVVLGATAAHNLLQIKTPISRLRGNFQDYFGVKVMPTFHPAYLLRDPHKKREVWEDMKKVRDYLAGSEE